MRDAIRVSVESDYEAETVRVHDEAGEVTAGGATFRVSVDGADVERTETEARQRDETGNSDDAQDRRFVAALAEIPTDSTLRCEAMDGRRATELIVRREGDDVFAWRNSCPHKPKVPLDPGGGAIVDDDQIVCHEHGARFDCGDGVCTYGPCRGDVLDDIEVAVRDGDVYLSDERFDGCIRLD